MYNRYIPQPDGSYRRCKQPDSGQQAQMRNPPSPKEQAPPPPPPYIPSAEHKPQPKPLPNPQGMGFLRQLLPRDFDTGDLIVILLLLLMAGDCEESRSSAILTIALYILM